MKTAHQKKMQTEDENNECTICKCTMTVPSFDAACVEGASEGGNCFRLPCKHAFHATCLVQSLRSSSNMCPVCRDTGMQAAPDDEIYRTRRERVNHSAIEDDDEDVDQTQDFAARVLHSLESSNPRVIAAKRCLMDNIRAYNLMRDRLRHERRRAIASAMHEFRQMHLRDFHASKRRVSDSLDAFHNQVRQEMNAGVEDLQFSSVVEVLRQQGGILHSVRHQDPTRISFWHP